MIKPFLFTFVFLAFVFCSFSQPAGIGVKVSSKGLYVEHQVTAKENFYSIGRDYNVHPKHLAAFNGLEMAKGLSLGQVVNIPLSDTNFVHKTAKGIPVYYQSSAKQTIATVSALSKTTPANLRSLNGLSGDNISAGSLLIIGYLLASVPANATTVIDAAETKTVITEKQSPSTSNPSKKDATEPTTGPKADTIAEVSTLVTTAEHKDEQPVKRVVESNLPGDGYFKASFVQQVKTYPLSKEETVTCGIFKTTSGWSDAKFYALIDNVEPGTIIRIVNPGNNKEVYAKVLGQMSGIRQNQGLNLRISNAAASVLEIQETDKFIVKVNY